MGRALKHEYQGGEYSSKELANIAGVSTRLFTHRVSTCGWSVEDAIAGTKTEITVAKSKRAARGRKLTCFATTFGVCNAK
jgi:uncharacterized protein YjcR